MEPRLPTLLMPSRASRDSHVVRFRRVPSARDEVVDERYLLQGHFARVTSAIAGSEPGAIVYEVNGTRYATKALSVDGTPVDADTEVVIERVEDGVAYVEPWARVEERL